MNRSPRTQPAVTRRPDQIRDDLAAMEDRVASARRDPLFLDPDSEAAADHAWASRRAALLRSEFADATRGRGPQPTQADAPTRY